MVALSTCHGERSRLEGYVPLEHPLRRVRAAIDVPLGSLHEELRQAGAAVGALMEPEKTVRALLVQLLFSIPSDRQLLDQIWDSVLLRWFIGVRIDEPKWELARFSLHRKQFLKLDIVQEVLVRGLTQAHHDGLLSFEALAARRFELAQLVADLAAGVGRPGLGRA